MAVDAGNGMGHVRTGFLVGHGVECFESFYEIPVPHFFHGRVGRRMALEAGARLLGNELAPGIELVLQHIGMAAFLPEVLREGIPGPHGFKPRVCFQFGPGHDGTGVGFRGRPWHGFAASKACSDLVDGPGIGIVLKGKVFPPHGRIHRLIGQFHHSEKDILGLLLSLENIHQQGDHSDRGNGRDQEHQREFFRSGFGSIHAILIIFVKKWSIIYGRHPGGTGYREALRRGPDRRSWPPRSAGDISDSSGPSTGTSSGEFEFRRETIRW
jgi:hypothetical protein